MRTLEQRAVLGALAPLLLYPTAAMADQLAFCRGTLGANASSALKTSLAFLASRPRFELEELYTRTFDLNPVCTLEVGWHLFGEQYERGRFLVRTRQLLSDLGIDEGGELPDFLPSLLLALECQKEEAAVHLGAILLPAVGKMCEALAEKDNPYQPILEAVRQTLASFVPAEDAETMEGRYRPHMKPPKQDLVQIGSKRGGQP